jgi:AcrR family transcriptional regulator
LRKRARCAIMHNMHQSSNKGLRDRKRAATYRAIEEAAVEVALEHGYEATTAEAIAERANVSLRTLFNYFPSKDRAIAGRAVALVDRDRARELLDECAPDIFKGMTRIVAAASAGTDFDSTLMRRRHDLICRNPTLLHQQLMAVQEMEEGLARIVADYLRDEPSRRHLSGRATVEEEARLVVTVVGAAIRYSMKMWLENDAASLDPARGIENALDLMAQIHRKNLS